jgi:succinate dehydrogenase / fumarate reductase cytochrome b subunit
MSTFMSSLQTTLKGYLSYRGREGHISFLLHRITGLGTLLFLAIHIVDTSFAYFNPELYGHALELYANPLFMLGEIALVFCVIFHGVNGLRIAYVDLRKPSAWSIHAQRKAVVWTLGISIVHWLPAAGIMGYNLLHHSLGWI